MSVLHINKESFEKVINQSQIPVLVDFWAPWCGPCRMLAPVLDELSDEEEGQVLIAKVNVDDEMALASQFGIASIPTMLLFQNGEVIKRAVGVQSKENLRDMWE